MQRMKTKCRLASRWGRSKFGSKSAPKDLGLGVHRQRQLYVRLSAERRWMTRREDVINVLSIYTRSIS